MMVKRWSCPPLAALPFLPPLLPPAAGLSVHMHA